MFALPIIDPEFKDLIPPLHVEERAQLEQNILCYGKCRDALILWNGIIVDGHNRFEICMEHGIEFEIIEMSFSSREEVMLWILENQLGRRNLTDAMRIELALSKAELYRERAERKKSLSGGNKRGVAPVLSKTSKLVEEDTSRVRKALATDAGVSEGTLYNYMQIKENASPELLERVKTGELKIGTAHRMLGKEILKQLRNASKEYSFILKNIHAHPDIPSRLSELSTQLHTLIAKMEESA